MFLKKLLNLHNHPPDDTIGRIIKEFQENGSLKDEKGEKYGRSGGAQENIDLARDSVAEDTKFFLIY